MLLAASPLVGDVTGRYSEDCNEAEQIRQGLTDFSGGVAPRHWMLKTRGG